MILPQPDSTAINPVGRIMPVLAVASIADTAQDQNFRALQFIKGQEYFAQVVARVDDTSFNVRVDGALLKMNLGNAAQVGQNLMLKFMESNPVPTFLLTQNNPKLTESSVSLSSAANMLGQYLKQAEQAGTPSRLEATVAITQTPNNTQTMAQDLKQAISGSGLFYESHLSSFAQGQRSLAAILQEPQNQALQSAQNQTALNATSQALAQNQINTPVAALLAQQLNVLENQRVAWHGDVWPGQQMEWNIYREQSQRENSRHEENLARGHSAGNQADDRPIGSELTLHLPNLGKVTAKLHLEDGRMRIHLLAAEADAITTLRQQSQALVSAMEKNGQALDALLVTPDE